MIYLIACGIIGLIFGFLLFASPDRLKELGGFFNQVVFPLDEKLWPFRVLVGIILLIVAVWKLYVLLAYEVWALWHFHVPWVIAFLFGLLFLALPILLQKLSDLSNRTLLITDELVLRSRKTVGLVLILASLYILFSAYLIR